MPNCQNCKQNFVIEPDDFAFYEKMQVPGPTWCPTCRLQRRLTFRNERSFHKRKCDLCNKNIISVYAPDSPYRVFCATCWYSDKWDPLIFRKNYSFSEPFLKQLQELLKEVPRRALNITNNVNSDYTNYAAENKNCYLGFSIIYSEDCAYGNRILYCKECFDCLDVQKSELCYECIHVRECSRSTFCEYSESLVDCHLCYDCKGLTNCFGCVGIRNQNHYWLNQPLQKEEYEEKLRNVLQNEEEWKKAEEEYKKLLLSFPHRYARILKSQNATGDNITNSKNCENCFFVNEVENSKNLLSCGKMKDSLDVSLDDESELDYELTSGQTNARGILGVMCWYSRDIQYSDSCIDSGNLFGCVGLRKKNYCVLNKQYSKEEYEELLLKIKKHMSEVPYKDSQGREYRYGEFFPFEFSPFGYNETVAQEYITLSKAEAKSKGLNWREPETKNYEITIQPENTPKKGEELPDTLTKEVIGCEHKGTCNDNCTTAFKILPQELTFYKRMSLTLPTLCPNCRHYRRMKERNPINLHHRACQCAGEKSENGIYTNTATHTHHNKDHCPNKFETTYSPERKEIIYCEACYQQEVM